MNSEPIKMVEECSYYYRAEEQADGSIVITIKAEKRFCNLWIVKLNSLTTSEEEIAYYEHD